MLRRSCALLNTKGVTMEVDNSKIGTINSDFKLVGTDFGPDGRTFPAGSLCPNNDSPAISWSGAPPDTRTFAVILHAPLDDVPDRPPFKWWWMLFNIPQSVDSLAAGDLGGGILGSNSCKGEIIGGYSPPCPRDSEVHTIRLTIYALSGALDISAPESVSYDELIGVMEGEIIDTSQLHASFQIIRD
jgi:phosphatidylethanolamine-binding protein (PEBP) family uncharacterized protein